MSQINDLIGIVRGLRLVVEAGLKLQQETSKTIWNNSSIRALAQTCTTTNPLTAFKPSSSNASEFFQKAQVVIHGFRQYAIMHVPNVDTNLDKKDMDPELRAEIEELNREFNRTFESLKTSQESKASTMPPVNVEFVSPLDGFDEKKKEKAKLQSVPKVEPVRVEPVRVVPEMSTSNFGVASDAGVVPKPVAKKKIRVSVSVSS